MVDELKRGGGQGHSQGGRKGKTGTCRSRKSSMCWGTVFDVMGRVHKGSKRHCAKGWAAGGATLFLPVEKFFSANEMPRSAMFPVLH